MIGAGDVDTLLFDVLGTVVDEAGSMRAELAAALAQAGAGEQAEALAGPLAAAWARRFDAPVPTPRCTSSPWTGWPSTRAALMVAAEPPPARRPRA
jgi:phosphoglycolate phosphatase-like HAD superfamily hydrolase